MSCTVVVARFQYREMGNVAGAARKRFELWLETAKKAKSRAAQVCNRHRKSQRQAEVEAKKKKKKKKRNETKQQSAIWLIVVIVIVVIVHGCCFC